MKRHVRTCVGLAFFSALTHISAICGDGLVLGPEECDDNNTVPNDGCTNCQKDYGFDCRGDTSSSTYCYRMCFFFFFVINMYVNSTITLTCLLFFVAFSLTISAICGDGHTVSGRETCDDGFGKDTTPHPVGIQFGCNNDCTQNVGWNCVNDFVTARKSNCTSMIFFLQSEYRIIFSLKQKHVFT